MKKQLSGIILAGFLLLSLLTTAQSNNSPVTTIKGKEYYQYTILPGEGLLSIGRKFDVSADEITKVSPEVKDGLKVGQQILIPVKKKSGKKSVNQLNLTLEFVQHKVDKKQTLFSISRKYKVTEEDIVKYNPGIEKGLKEGIILQIPKMVKEKKKKEKEIALQSNIKNTQADQVEKKPVFKTHKVKANETLFSISRRYKVDIPDIIQYNPGSDTKLVVGSELKIPTNIAAKELKKDNLPNVTTATTEKKKEIENIATVKFSEHKNIKIAFLLPLMVDQVKKDAGDERFINFYEGSLLAINQAKQRGISFEIYTYDTEKSEDRIKELLNNPELKSVDLIIGPAYSNLVPYIEKFAKENKINTLIPFTSKVSDIDTNPYLFQFNPGQDTELDFFSDLIIGKYKNTRIIFAEIEDISALDEGKIRADALKKKLTKEHRTYSTIGLSASDKADFTTVLKKGDRNLIIFNTDKYANVSPFINSISSKSTLFDIVLFEQYNWRNQTDNSVSTIYIAPFVSRFNPVKINEYNQEFDQFFGKDVTTDSPRYDLLGYDLSNYFISLINRFGTKYGNKINSGNFEKGIQSDPLFERSSPNAGYINQRVYLGEDKAK